MVPKAFALLVSGLVGLLPTVGSAPLDDQISNGGFEDGLAEWRGFGSPVTCARAGAVSSQALCINNSPTGRYAYQSLAPREGSLADVIPFGAPYLGQGSADAPNQIEFLSGWGVAGQERCIAWVTFRNGALQFAAFETDARILGGGYAEAAFANDGSWHAYQVVLVPDQGKGLLFEDGILRAGYQSDPGNAVPPTVVIVGDTAADRVVGPAPTVHWDNIAYRSTTGAV